MEIESGVLALRQVENYALAPNAMITRWILVWLT